MAKNIEKNSNNISLMESNLYNALDKIDENSVDVFYADNVMEHIAPDEYEETCEKIFSKVKKDGVILFIIPNSYTGPNDISRLRFPNGGKATGFHFMEQSYKENVYIRKKVGHCIDHDKAGHRGRCQDNGYTSQYHTDK